MPFKQDRDDNSGVMSSLRLYYTPYMHSIIIIDNHEIRLFDRSFMSL